MKKSRHTTGPWNVSNGVYGNSITGRAQSGVNGGMVAPCICKSGNMHEWSANAALIAAAPDLLAALRECRDIMANHCLATDARAAVADVMARDAIAKAEGRE